MPWLYKAVQGEQALLALADQEAADLEPEVQILKRKSVFFAIILTRRVQAVFPKPQNHVMIALKKIALFNADLERRIIREPSLLAQRIIGLVNTKLWKDPAI